MKSRCSRIVQARSESTYRNRAIGVLRGDGQNTYHPILTCRCPAGSLRALLGSPARLAEVAQSATQTRLAYQLAPSLTGLESPKTDLPRVRSRPPHSGSRLALASVLTDSRRER